jgi:hypothetical protein
VLSIAGAHATHCVRPNRQTSMFARILVVALLLLTSSLIDARSKPKKHHHDIAHVARLVDNHSNDKRGDHRAATCAFSTVARTVRCLTCRSTAASKCNRPLIMPTTATTTLIQAMTAISADATTSTIWSLKPPNPMCHKTAFRRASTPTVMECRISAIDVPTRKTPSIPTTRVHQRRRRRQDNQLMRRQRNHQQPECRLARLGVASLAKSSAPTARLAMSVRSFHRRCSCLARVCPAVRVPRSMARQSLARLKRLLRLQVRPALRQQVQRLVRHLAT